MNLAAQIELITVPQEFMRLCDALLAAEHGTAYLPIDDSSPDRGNDGYLKTEKRLFAVHCFKRVQNQRLRAAIRGKMVGDLGKAIALKQQGIWDIEAWTFVSNYPVSEEVAESVVRMGEAAGVGVSWLGPDYLAGALQRHKSVRALFPALQVTDVADQIDQLARAVSDATRHEAEPEQVGIPHTPQQQASLIRTKPGGWEYLLFAGVLIQGMESLELKWHDHELGIISSSGRRLTQEEAPDYLSDQFDRITTAMDSMMRVFTAEAQERAFGPPGEPGDARRIEHTGKRIVACYEEMLDWASEVRSAIVPPVFEGVFRAATRMADRPIDEMRAFIERAEVEIGRIPDHVALPEEEQSTLRIELDLVLSIDDDVLAEFNRQMKRTRRKLRWGF